VDSALVTAVSLLHSKAPADAVFILIASDGDFHSTLSRLRDASRDIHIVTWLPSASGNPLAAGLTTFLKAKQRQPGEEEQYFYLDEVLTVPFAVPGLHENGWDCAVCGFSNKETNSVCGGTGPKGCKAPKPLDSDGPSEWVCGFKNKASNDVCGGRGQMGCKKPKPNHSPSGHDSAHATIEPCRYLASSVGSNRGDAWHFSHRPEDAVAANDHQRHLLDKGFKASEVISSSHSASGYGAAHATFDTPEKSVSKEATKGARFGAWDCIRCGFSNNPGNAVCGGKGPMGCKAHKPSESERPSGFQNLMVDWSCECGFKNKPTNEICGGGGKLGCNRPRPQHQ
jgi:hypothetical protein